MSILPYEHHDVEGVLATLAPDAIHDVVVGPMVPAPWPWKPRGTSIRRCLRIYPEIR